MWKYILKRILEAIPVLLIVYTITFALLKIAPGGPFDSEKQVSPEVKKALEAHYGFDKPLHIQYTSNLVKALKGNLGISTRFKGRTVREIVSEGLPRTLVLGGMAICIALFFGLLAGVTASLKKNTLLDYIPMSIAMFGICVPTFLLGPVLVLIFSIYLGWLPTAGWDASFQHKILPAITLGAAYAAFIARLSRGGMLEVLSQDYIRTAKAKGLSPQRVLFKHALKGGIFPVISFLGPAVAGLLAGSFVVETIFMIPGIGKYYVQSALNRDLTLTMGMTLFLSFLIIGFNMLSDIFLIWLNPKLSFSKESK